MVDKVSRVKGLAAQHPETLTLEKEAQLVHQEWTAARLKFLQVRALFQALKQTQYEAGSSNAGVSQRLFIPENVEDLQGLKQPRSLPSPGPKTASDLQAKLDSVTHALMRFYPEVDDAAGLPDAVAADVADADSLKTVSAPDLDQAVNRKQADEKQLKLLTDIVDNNYMKSAADRVKINVDHLEARQTSLEKKLELTKMEVKTVTYNPTAVSLLERLRHKLKEEMAQVKAEVDTVRKELGKYQAVSGPDFQAVVDTYAQVIADIEGKEWALSKFDEESN